MESESKLLGEYIGGEKDSFIKILELYQETVYTFLYLSLPNKLLVPKAFQEVFRLISIRAPEFKGKTSLRCWILQITTQVGHEIKKKKLFSREKNRAPVNSQLITVDEAEPEEEFKEIVKALNLLKSDQKTVVILHDNLAIPILEIAQILKLSMNSVLLLLHRGRRNGAQTLSRWKKT
ncbi:RNA polymerase sigma factor [candidate division CSSED10-310 bacterium]|uniref:RNA polymerase sigma factor n=1 Tax=candidate division CSSED10-310 bacterium TaxID=2855610 RepID=A0ABV6YXG5_UNCC1